MINYCEGCATYVDEGMTWMDHYCPYKIYNKNGECPCVICLVKCMCKTPCKHFDYFTNLHKEK